MTPFRNTLKPLTATALLSGGIALLSTSAFAAATNTQKVTANAYGEDVTITVPMDLLDTEEGTRSLYAALERRAEKSCKTTIPLRVGHPISAKRCKNTLMDDFVTEISDEGLSALHQKNG
jgi:UrcA family protein